MRLITLDWFECPRCGVLVAPDTEVWAQKMESGFCADYFVIVCIECGGKV